jgi:cytoskeletal protein RodZ
MLLLAGYLFHVPTVAEQLRQARESLHLTVEQVVDVTKLKADHVRALDAGDYAAFDAPIYLRGSLRTYARLLKLDSEKLLAELDTETSGSSTADHASISPIRQKSGVDKFMLLLSRVNWVVAAVVLLGALVVFGAIFGFKAWRRHQTSDPLRGLGPGMYQPSPDSAERLPIPTNVPSRR